MVITRVRVKFKYIPRAGSRIFRRGEDVDPFRGGFGLQRGHFSVKMYAKTKELGPVGGRVPARPLDPPMIPVKAFHTKYF